MQMKNNSCQNIIEKGDIKIVIEKIEHGEWNYICRKVH